MNKLIEIAKANGAEKHVTFNKNGIHETGKILFTTDQLRATVEQVCAPLVEALNRAIDDDPAYILVCCQAVENYRTLIGDKE